MFGHVVREHRRRIGLSQEELADRTGVGVRSIGKIENGRISAPRPVTVRLLADAFGLTGDERDEFCQAAASQPASVPPPARPGSTPAQLPADVTGFVGREQALAQLDGLLEERAEQHPAAVLITAIAGTAGIGKTTLAVHWGHRIRHRFPDGQLYLNLRGFGGSAMHPAEAVRRFLDALEVTPERVPADLQAQAALYRTRLAGRRMLILLDNARDAEQVRPLLPGAPGCLVVITSRYRLSSLVAADSAHPLALGVLSPQEARELLATRLGPARTAAEPDAVEEIIASCAQLPLALAIAAARAATQPQFPLRALAAELRDSRDRLDVLAAGDDPATDVRSVFSWSYRALSREAARLFRLLGLHPGPDVGTAAAAGLAGLPLRTVRRLLSELAGAHLIVEHSPGRYTFHDLLRAYAAEEAQEGEQEAERAAALRRVLDYYLHTANAAAMLLNPGRDPIEVAPASPGVTAQHLDGHAAATAWFCAEHRVLLAAVERAGVQGLDTHAWQLAWTLVHHLDRGGHWHDWAATQRAALVAAQRLQDPMAQAVAHRLLALALIQLACFEEAYQHLELALELYRQAGDLVGQAHAHLHLGLAWVRQGQFGRALAASEQSLRLFGAAGHRPGQALALNGFGWLQARLGEHHQALASCRQALALQQPLGNLDDQAATWDSLGYVHARLGDHAEALECYRQAVALRRDIGDRYGEASSLTRLGDIHQARGDTEAAPRAWAAALVLLEVLDHPDAEPVRGRLAATREAQPAGPWSGGPAARRR